MTIEFITCVGLIVVGPIVWALAVETEHGAPHTEKALLGQSNSGGEMGAPEPPGDRPPPSVPGHHTRRAP